MLRRFLHHLRTNRSATRLTAGSALVLAGGLLLAGWFGTRLVLSGRSSASPRSGASEVAVNPAGSGEETRSGQTDSGKEPAPNGPAFAGDRQPEDRGAGVQDGNNRTDLSPESGGDELFAAWDRLERRIASVMARARESVVALEYTAADEPAGTRRVATGVVINNRGEILSVRIDPPSPRPGPGKGKNLAPIVARDFQGRGHAAQWIAADPETGLTLLRVSPRAVRPIRCATEEPKLGCQVFVVGSPFGMGHSVSRGHVAGLDRALELGNSQLGGLIQVQAPIYPGDSGAAVVNLRGDWLGLIRGGLAVPGSGSDTETESTSTAEPPASVSRPDSADPNDELSSTAAIRSEPDTDFGFAIPTRDGLWIASQLRTHGYVDRAYLGIRIATTPITTAAGPQVSATNGPGDPDNAPASSVAAGGGAQVRDVIADTPAALAGLRPGDRIVALDGQPIRSHHDLIDRLDRIPARKAITMSIIRGEDSTARTIEVGLKTASRPRPSPTSPSAITAHPAETSSTSARANVPVTPTASRTNPPSPTVPAPASVPGTPTAPSVPRTDPAPGALASPRPVDPDHGLSDRAKPLTPALSPSLNDLRLNLPRAFVERLEKLERRLEKLETVPPPTPPALAPVLVPGTKPRPTDRSVANP